MKKVILKEKEELKQLAKEIRALKFSRKLPNRNGRSLWDIECDIYSKKHEFRYRHIVYCMARGTKLEQIEQYCRPNNLQCKHWIEKYQERFDKLVQEAENEETVCNLSA